jgi:hypothetical protein
MKDEFRINVKSSKPYSPEIVEQLKRDGYKYFSIVGYSQDRRPTYMEPRYILLTPIRDLSKNGANEIYEPIDSDILKKWATHATETKIFVAR